MELSIIVPVYNAEGHLKKCLDSIQNACKSFKGKYELIVVDDASTDNSLNIAEKYNCEIVKQKINSGPAKARNTAANYAKGDILVFVDSDVELLPDSLIKMERFFEKNPDYISVFSSFNPVCTMKDSVSRYKHLHMWYSFEEQSSLINMIYTPFCGIRKKYFSKFDERLRHCEDFKLGYELANKGYKLGFDKDNPIRHYHVYNIWKFVKEEYRRSRNVIRIKLTSWLKRRNVKNKTHRLNIILSIVIFPFIILGLFFSKHSFLYAAAPITLFFLANIDFLKHAYRFFGLFFALKSFFLLMLDSLICIIGIFAGMLRFLCGERF
jgi:glycosyltransferase involved in cell wall biosynthesis